MIQLYHGIMHCDLEKTYYENEYQKENQSNQQQNQAKQSSRWLRQQTAKISALS